MFNFLVNVLHVSLKENGIEQHKESIFLLLTKNCSRRFMLDTRSRDCYIIFDTHCYL